MLDHGFVGMLNELELEKKAKASKVRVEFDPEWAPLHLQYLFESEALGLRVFLWELFVLKSTRMKDCAHVKDFQRMFDTHFGHIFVLCCSPDLVCTME